jgi:mono/diheme cytochrome c family protein
LTEEFRRRLLEARETLLRVVEAADEELAGLEAPAPGDATDRAAAPAGLRGLRHLRIVPGAHRAPASSGRACGAVLPRLSGSRGGGSMIPRAVLVISVVLLASCVQAQDGPALVGQGRMVFRDQGCYGCHTAERMGTPIGPDLSRIGAKRDQTYLTRWLRDPSAQRPSAHMPKLQLTEAEVRALAAYLASLR